MLNAPKALARARRLYAAGHADVARMIEEAVRQAVQMGRTR